MKLPPQLGYGMRGAGCKGGKQNSKLLQNDNNQNSESNNVPFVGSCIIPPDSVLLFDVEFIGKA